MTSGAFARPGMQEGGAPVARNPALCSRSVGGSVRLRSEGNSAALVAQLGFDRSSGVPPGFRRRVAPKPSIWRASCPLRLPVARSAAPQSLSARSRSPSPRPGAMGPPKASVHGQRGGRWRTCGRPFHDRDSAKDSRALGYPQGRGFSLSPPAPRVGGEAFRRASGRGGPRRRVRARRPAPGPALRASA